MPTSTGSVSVRRRPRLRLAVLTLACVLLAGPDAADAEKRDWDLYVRDVKGIERAVEMLATEAKLRGVKDVLVAFDQITFDPPRSQNEYTDTHGYVSDLDEWLVALEGWAKKTGASGPSIHAVATLGPSPVRVGAPAWQHAIRHALDYRWFEDDRFGGFLPAHQWVRRWAPRSEGMLVLIVSELTPERWVDPHAFLAREERWRRHLLEPGLYWDEEEIGKALDRRDCALIVVAPEVTFGDELPAPALPALPWAARPHRPYAPPLHLLEDLLQGTPTPAPQGPDPTSPDDLRKVLDELLEPLYPDPEERKRIIDEILEKGGPPPAIPPGRPGLPPLPGVPPGPGGGPRVPATPGTPATPGEDDEVPLTGGRFLARTPLWFPHHGGTVLVNDHTPSAFGYWPYARAAARTGGRYLCYPFPPAPWLDVCPRDALQLKRMAPELVRRQTFRKARAGDAAYAALARAEAMVVRETPWSDSWGARLAKGWDAFESVRPLKATRGFRLRRKPYDLHLSGRMRSLQREGRRLAEVVEQYDRAVRILDRALERVRKGQDTPHPRALADLRLGRYWFSMSAFHLEALGIYLRECERFAPPGWDAKRGELTVSYIPAIRMSDCLDAYDGRELMPEDEARYSRTLHRARGEAIKGIWEEGQEIPGQQGNILSIPRGDRNYRAKRSLSSVLRYLDRRLMPRALDMIRAARAVMTHHAKTPWGWTTYYAEAFTFVFYPVPPGKWVAPRTGEEGENEPPPWTPTPRDGGGSTPGGPVTPR